VKMEMTFLIVVGIGRDYKNVAQAAVRLNETLFLSELFYRSLMLLKDFLVEVAVYS